MNLNKKLNTLFLEKVLSTPAGRAHVLNQAADAEGSDEAGFFERLLSKVDDPELQKMIRRHEADEKRHESMFLEAVTRTGIQPEPVPSQLKLIEAIDEELGGFFERPITDDRGVMEAYLLLQVIEERAITQFALMEPAFRKVDPETADQIVEIMRDEERHLKYCRAISRRYAPDNQTRESTLRWYRGVEARAFASIGRENLRYNVKHDLLPAGPLAKMGWRLLALVSQLVGAVDYTPFYEAPSAVGATELAGASA